ncbi:MAG: hypothetical protein ACT4O9_04630 [Blastocatellia bacterium]
MRKSGQTPFLCVLWLVIIAFLAVTSAPNTYGQDVVDKTLATVSDGVRTELITLSDVRWQLALQPNTNLSPPSTEDMNRALRLLIDQKVFSIEAERLPRNAPTEKEIGDKITEILAYFPSTAEFEKRLRIVGFTSIKDENFERIIAQRVAIDKYLDFRFRSFVVVTPEDEARYYRDVFVPDFRRRSPGLLLPALEEKRAEIRRILTEATVATNIETFLDEAKRRIEIVSLIEP